MRYLVKTHILRNFDYGEVLYPTNRGQQYAKLNAFPGDDCLSLDFIQKNPEYFSAFEDEVDRFVSLYNRAKELKLI